MASIQMYGDRLMLSAIILGWIFSIEMMCATFLLHSAIYGDVIPVLRFSVGVFICSCFMLPMVFSLSSIVMSSGNDLMRFLIVVVLFSVLVSVIVFFIEGQLKFVESTFLAYLFFFSLPIATILLLETFSFLLKRGVKA